MIDFGKDAQFLRERLEQVVSDYCKLNAGPVTRLDLDIWLGDGGDTPPAATVHIDSCGNDWPGDGSHPSFAVIEFPHWRAEYDEDELDVRPIDGSSRRITTAKRDQTFHGFFVTALLAARKAGVFDPLPKSMTCELGVANFECGFAWPDDDERGLVNMADPRHNGTRLSANPPLSIAQRVAQDGNAYDLWIDLNLANRTTAIATVNAVLGIGLPAARALIESGEPILRDESASEIRRVAKLIRAKSIDVRIDPPFPFPLEA